MCPEKGECPKKQAVLRRALLVPASQAQVKKIKKLALI